MRLPVSFLPQSHWVFLELPLTTNQPLPGIVHYVNIDLPYGHAADRQDGLTEGI
jgi:hypothetical protein